VNQSTGADGEPTLADVQLEFCGWECWRGVSGLYYGRQPGRPRRHRAKVQGEDPRDLRDQIIRAISKDEEARTGPEHQTYRRKEAEQDP
jgi:hypothetical protein